MDKKDLKGYKWAKEVVEGKFIANKWVKLECKRYIGRVDGEETDIEFDFKEAEGCMKKAHDHIVKAHTLHTEIIQQNMDSMEGQPYYMIFAHAQDTLMTINSEILIAKHLLKISKALISKIESLEIE